MSEPRPLSLGDLLRFDRERRSRESSLQTDEASVPPATTPPNVANSRVNDDAELKENLASQSVENLDSQSDLDLASQIRITNDNQKLRSDFDSNAIGQVNSDKSNKPSYYKENIQAVEHTDLASQTRREVDSQTNFLASQKADLASQKSSLNDDLAIKKAKSNKKLIAKKGSEKRWTRYERNRDRSGERGEFFCRPRNAILKQAKHLMVEHGLKTHEFFELATTMLGEYLASQKGKSLAILISTDNDRLMKTFISDTRIINLYRDVTGNRWTMTDDSVGVKFNDLDFRIVEIAVIRTYIRWMKIPSKKPIKWFKYFKDEIELHAEELKTHSVNTIDVMATQARKLLELVKQGIEVDA